jgi:alanyl-tRNA synthetase
MTSSAIRQKFLDFFAKRGHAVIPSASLVPKNDPSVLFNTAGMQPLVPYLLGEPHPLGNRLVNCQKCVRTGDIEEVGNHKNLTFFEMLGNWSLGDYFKDEAISWSYEFLTAPEGLGLDPSRLYVTVFEGDDTAPRDMEAVEIWKRYIPTNRIYYMPAANNWWSPGDNGPCGPDTEMFYDVTPHGLGDLSHDEYVAADERGDVVEIWNDVFMEYEKKNGTVIGKLASRNVDTGSGLERITMLVQGVSNVYETDIFLPVMNLLTTHSTAYLEHSGRIIADHLRTATMLIADGVLPSNKDQGYILRRLIRRALVHARRLSLTDEVLTEAISLYTQAYKETYPEVIQTDIASVFTVEAAKFRKTLEQGLKEFEKGTDPFVLATTYGFPIELTMELAAEYHKYVDVEGFWVQMKAHQEASRAGAVQKFKGGLANTSDRTVQLHTAHHLLLAALQEVLGPSVHQKGSNITDERLRIDFNFDRKLTEEEKHSIEAWVNEKIAKDYKVVKRDMPRSEAEQIGAEMEFGTTYPEQVSVYFIEDESGSAISKEFCGGPHVTHTGALGTFRLLKEETVAAGVRRIKATLS